MPRRVNVLTDMEFDEISLVDRPANQHAKVAIAKRATEEEPVPEIYDENGNPLDADALEIDQIVYDGEGNAYIYTYEDEDDQPVMEEERELATVGKSLADDVRESLSKAFTDIERDEIISKALGEVSKAEARAKAAEEIAKAERDLRLNREYVEVAKGYNVPVDPSELGPVLKRAAEALSYEDCAVIHKALTAAGEALFAEVGFIGGGDNADVMSQVDAIVSEQVSKSAGTDPAKATVDYFLNNPAAYDEYLANQAR